MSPGALLESRERFGSLFLRGLKLPGGRPAPTVIFVPGTAHGWWAWSLWQPAFAWCGIPSIALSFPNHTDAPVLEERDFLSLTLDDHARMVREAAAAVGGPVILCGHSLGGITAQLAAESMVELAGLVLVASVGPSQLGITRRELHPPDRPMRVAESDARRRWFADADPWVIDWAMGQLSPESPGVVNASGGRTIVAIDRIRCPVLVVSGGLDTSSVPPQDRLAALYRADHIAIPGAGHDLMLERGAAAAARKVIAWIDRRFG